MIEILCATSILVAYIYGLKHYWKDFGTVERILMLAIGAIMVGLLAIGVNVELL